MAPADHRRSLLWQARPASTSGLSWAVLFGEPAAPGCTSSDGGLAGLQTDSHFVVSSDRIGSRLAWFFRGCYSVCLMRQLGLSVLCHVAPVGRLCLGADPAHRTVSAPGIQMIGFCDSLSMPVSAHAFVALFPASRGGRSSPIAFARRSVLDRRYRHTIMAMLCLTCA